MSVTGLCGSDRMSILSRFWMKLTVFSFHHLFTISFLSLPTIPLLSYLRDALPAPHHTHLLVLPLASLVLVLVLVPALAPQSTTTPTEPTVSSRSNLPWSSATKHPESSPPSHPLYLPDPHSRSVTRWLWKLEYTVKCANTVKSVDTISALE
jgi:hypothetical protein